MDTLHEVQVRENVWVWTLGGDGLGTSYGANCVAVIGEAGVILIDPLGAPAHARQVEAALRKKTNRPVRVVILTHHHADHTWGASHFVRQGALLLAHRACRERMAAEHPTLLVMRQAQPEAVDLLREVVLVLPSLTFDEGVGLHLGVEVEVWHPGHAHSPGDAFLYLPEAGVAVCGDLVFSGYHFHYEHADPIGVRQGLQALRALDAEVFVPGHGEPGGPELLEAQAAYHEEVEEVVRRALAAGKGERETVADLRARFPNYRLEWVLPITYQRLRQWLQQPKEGRL